MRIDGHWLLCDDGEIRPVVRGHWLRADATWFSVPMLVDTGADRTVLSQSVLNDLGLSPTDTGGVLGGIGGTTSIVAVETILRFRDSLDRPVDFRGRFRAFTDPAALDISVLGRDLLNHFAVLIDRPHDRICLLSQRHECVIVER